jgi:hypothetical protein
MPTKYYEWGNFVGGASGGGVPVPPADAMYGTGQQFQGDLPIGDTTITFTAPTKSIKVINQDDADGFSVSLDGGTTWIVLGTYGQLEENVSVTSIILRATVAGVAYYVSGILTA